MMKDAKNKAVVWAGMVLVLAMLAYGQLSLPAPLDDLFNQTNGSEDNITIITHYVVRGADWDEEVNTTSGDRVKKYHPTVVNVPEGDKGRFIPIEDFFNLSLKGNTLQIFDIKNGSCSIVPEYYSTDVKQALPTTYDIQKFRGKWYFTTSTGAGFDSVSWNVSCANTFFEDNKLFVGNNLYIDFEQAEKEQNISTTFDTKTNKLSFTAIDGNISKLRFIDPTIHYNFSAQLNIEAYCYRTTDLSPPPASGPVPPDDGSNANVTGDSALDSIDSSGDICDLIRTSSKSLNNRFNFSIQETPSTITQLNITAELGGSNGFDGCEGHVYNYTSGSWVQIFTDAGCSSFVSYSKSWTDSNEIQDLVSADTGMTFIWQMDGSLDEAFTDYISLSVTSNNPLSSENGTLVYSTNSQDNPSLRNWTGGESGVWQDELDLADTDGGDSQTMLIIQSPIKDEKLLFAIDSNDDLNTWSYNGSEWSSTTEITIDGEQSRSFFKREFDAFYMNNGNAVLIYVNDTSTSFDDYVNVQIWDTDSQTWSLGEQDFFEAGTSFEGVRALPVKGTNRAAVVLTSSSPHINFSYWNGTYLITTSVSVVSTVMDTGLGEGFGMDYDYGDNIIFAYANTSTNSSYNLFNITTLAWQDSQTIPYTDSGTDENTAFAASSNGDYMMYVEKNSINEMTFLSYIEGAWTITDIDPGDGDSVGDIAVVFESVSDDALIVYHTTSNSMVYNTWNPTDGFGTETAISNVQGGTEFYFELFPNPNSDDILLLVSSTTDDLGTYWWDGDIFRTGEELETTLEAGAELIPTSSFAFTNYTHGITFLVDNATLNATTGNVSDHFKLNVSIAPGSDTVTSSVATLQYPNSTTADFPMSGIETLTPAATDYTDNQCTITWGADCDAQPDIDNAFGSCNGVQTGSAVLHNAYVNSTAMTGGGDLNATCYLFDNGNANVEMYIYYYNGSTWNQELSANTGACTDCNISTVVTVGTFIGEHVIRCIIDLDGEADTCADGGSHFDNDDVNFTVVEDTTTTSGVDFETFFNETSQTGTYSVTQILATLDSGATNTSTYSDLTFNIPAEDSCTPTDATEWTITDDCTLSTVINLCPNGVLITATGKLEILEAGSLTGSHRYVEDGGRFSYNNSNFNIGC